MRKLKAGDQVREYQVTERIVSGAFAMTYRGVDTSGNDVFIKQFKSPTPLTDWYPAFVEHQVKLQQRIDASAVRNFAITLVDQFEEALPPHGRGRCFFQVTEFVTHGKDLSELIAPSSSVRWHQRVVWAKVIMGSVHQFHQAKIVHTDLKPENLFLIEDRTIRAGYRLKVIDLDSAIFAGKQAPWHHNGYVGTPGYYSPEHGSRTTIPSDKSDIFSAGLILYDLLGDGHPYTDLSDDEYRKAVLAHRARSPKLHSRMAKSNDDEVAATIHRMVSPAPADRPSAKEVLDVLNGVKPRVRPIKPPPAPAPPTRVDPPLVPKSALSPLRLQGDSGKEITVKVKTTLCSSLVREIGESRYWDKVFQLRLEPRGGIWYVVPNPDAPNDTCINEKLVVAPTVLAKDDVITVGRASKGIFKSPLRIGLAGDV